MILFSILSKNCKHPKLCAKSKKTVKKLTVKVNVGGGFVKSNVIVFPFWGISGPTMLIN